jgi:hypothetical protein
MKALGDAFVSDDFAAEDFDLGGDAEQAIERFGAVVERGVGVAGSVLSATQRATLAALIRARAVEKM